jgi:hypothetical protein
MYAAFLNSKKWHVNLHSYAVSLRIKSPAKSKMIVNSCYLGERAPRTRCRLENNIKMALQGIGLEGVAWVHLVHDVDLWKVS